VDENIQAHLKSLHPDTFAGWDGFEINMRVRKRGDKEDMLVTLLNKHPTFIADIHATFLIVEAGDGSDIIRVGKHELADEYNSVYIPEFAK